VVVIVVVVVVFAVVVAVVVIVVVIVVVVLLLLLLLWVLLLLSMSYFDFLESVPFILRLMAHPDESIRKYTYENIAHNLQQEDQANFDIK